MRQKERDLKKRSKTIFEVIKKTPYYYAPLGFIKDLGLKEKDINNKPFIGVANTWNELNPGRKHLNTLTKAVKYGIIEGGCIPFELCVTSFIIYFKYRYK